MSARDTWRDRMLGGLSIPYRPRVSRCPLTLVWIVNPFGHRHRCRTYNAGDLAFRRWEIAMEHAHEEVRDQYRRIHGA